MSDEATQTSATPATTTTAAPVRQTLSQAMANIGKSPVVQPPTAKPATTPQAVTTTSAAPVTDAVKLVPTSEIPNDMGISADTADAADTQNDEQIEFEESAEAATTQDAIDYQAKYSEVFDSPDLHPELLNKMVMAKVNGNDMPITVDEALKGYMRRSDHSRQMAAAQKLEAEAKESMSAVKSVWESFKDNPQRAAEVFEDRFGTDYLDQLADYRMQARNKDNGLILAAGERMARSLGLQTREEAANNRQVLQAMEEMKNILDGNRVKEQELRKLKAQEAKFTETQKAQTDDVRVKEWETTFKQQLTRFGDVALKAEGIKPNTIAKAQLQQKVAAIMHIKGTTNVTQDIVREAAEILAEEVRDQRGLTAPKEPPLPVRQGMSPSAGARVSAAQAQPVSTRDFFKKLGH